MEPICGPRKLHLARLFETRPILTGFLVSIYTSYYRLLKACSTSKATKWTAGEKPMGPFARLKRKQ